MVRQSTWTTGGPRCAASSAAWLKPRARRRRGWSGTGTTQSASARRSAPCCRIKVPSVVASVGSARTAGKAPARTAADRRIDRTGGCQPRHRIPACGADKTARRSVEQRLTEGADRRQQHRQQGVETPTRRRSQAGCRGGAMVPQQAGDALRLFLSSASGLLSPGWNLEIAPPAPPYPRAARARRSPGSLA